MKRTHDVEPARLDDAEALARISGDWRRELPWMPILHSEAGDVRFMQRQIEEAQVWVVRVLAGPVGYLTYHDGEVDALYVAAGSRGDGIGRALLDEAKAHCDRLGLWAFQRNDRALDFYAREGFHESRRTDGEKNEERLPDVYLEWHREAVT